MLTNGQVFGSGNPTINIYGTNTVIQMDRLNLGTAARAMKFGFFFTNSGVSTVACPAAFMTLDYATINIDGAAYTSGPGTYTLFRSANFTGTLTYTANITAPFPGLNAVVSKSGNNLVVTLTEPPAPQSTWDGDSNGYWSVAANWAGNVAPVASNALIFAGTVSPVTTNDLTAGTLFKGITFSNTLNGQSFSLGGNSLNLAGNISSADVVTPDAIADSITLNQQLANSGLSVNLGSNHDLTISGVLSEDSAARGFTKAGAGTLTLSGTNTYTGVTTVSGGILNVSNNLALGTTAGNTVINGGAPPSGFGGSLRLPGGITLAEPLNISAGHYYAPALWSFGNNIVTGQISGSGRIQTDENGPGTLTLSGGISATGGSTLVGNIVIDTTPINAGSLITFAGTNVQKIAINVAGNSWVLGRIAFGGTVQLGVDNALPTTSAVEFGWSTLENSVGTLDLNGHNQTVASIGNSKTAVVPAGADLRIIGGGTLTVNQTTNTTFSGVISDGSIATALVKANTGTLNLTGTNAYTGNTTVNGGTLQIGVASIAANSTVTVATNATLQLDFMETNQVAGLVLNGVSQPAGVYNNSSTPTYILGSGSLQVGSATPNPATLTNSVSGGVLNLFWPAGQGWKLQAQTNLLTTGLSTNWAPITDGSVSSTNITIDSTQPAVFYRLTQ
jgi:autotransporter-associated beta strand protein